MAEFIYKAKDVGGSDHGGDVEAPDAHFAATILRRKGLIIISLKPKAPPVNFLLNLNLKPDSGLTYSGKRAIRL